MGSTSKSPVLYLLVSWESKLWCGQGSESARMDSRCVLQRFMGVKERAGVIHCILCPQCVHRCGAPCATTGWGRNLLWCPRAQPCSSFYGKDGSDMVPTWCGRVVTRLEGPLEAVDSLVGWSSKAIHRACIPRVKMLGQPPREVPFRMARDHWWWKHTDVCGWQKVPA
jgi:hypothetical protein